MIAVTGAAITAVEPSEAMRAAFARRFPDLPCLAGTATDIPLEDGSVDAVLCGQSFHWFATERALAEIRRVLVPDGALGLVWNVRDESKSWVAELTRLLDPYVGDTPRYRDGTWRSLFPGSGFGRLQENHCNHAHVGPPAQVVLDRILSISFIAALETAERQNLETAITDLIARTPDLAGKVEVAVPYHTTMAWARRET